MGEDGLGAVRCVEDLLGVDLVAGDGISTAGHSQMNDREPAGGSGQIHSDCRQFPGPPPWACITGPSGGVLRARDTGVVLVALDPSANGTANLSILGGGRSCSSSSKCPARPSRPREWAVSRARGCRRR